MKNALWFSLWLAVAVFAYFVGQPLVTFVIAILAATEIYAQFKLRPSASTGNANNGSSSGSSISKALASNGHGSRRHDWMLLL